MTEVGLRWIAVPGGDTGLLISSLQPGDVGPIAVCTDTAAEDVAAGAPGIAGRFVRRQDGMLFVPLFPLRDGCDYVVVSAGAVVGRIHREAAVLVPTTRVMAIHPSTTLLPENHLRFCVEFSGPMSRGIASRHMRLFREGDPDPMAAAILPDELWDRAGRRVTLLLEPGRIKRGLVPHTEAGSVIRAGVRYRLVIDPEWRDAAGAPLIEGAERAYLGAPAVREPIRVSEWTIDAHVDRVDVRFERPLDHTLILRCLSIEGDGGTIAGRAGVHESEVGWTFVPDDRLTPGEYALVIQPRLQDSAGNWTHRLFDHDISRSVPDWAEAHRLPIFIP